MSKLRTPILLRYGLMTAVALAANLFLSPATEASPMAGSIRPGLLKSYDGAYGFKPRSFNPSADGSLSFTRVLWGRLTPRVGYATATEHVNDCVPTCADGHFRVSRVALTFTAARPYHRNLIFTRFSDGRRWYDLPT
jgi:hypothetical protein